VIQVTRLIGGFLAALIAFTTIMTTGIPFAAATAKNTSQSLLPEATSYEVDAFTYRASLRLPDGTEGLLMRGSFTVTFLYEHHQPTVNELYMSVYIGFYYGKTMLGRSVVQSIKIASIAFYPKWYDSRGYPHDLYMVAPLFVLNDSIDDGQLTGGIFLMDGDAVSQYIMEFGGTVVIDKLAFVLGDGLEVPLAQDRVEIILEKYYNDYGPQAASLHDTDNLTFTSDSSMLTVTANGAAIVPYIVILDTLVGFFLICTGCVLVLLIILHLTGRMKLPFGRMRTLFMHGSERPQSTV
jgi:hypothetical protein